MINNFISNKKGIATIEFVFIFMLFSILLIVIVEIASVKVKYTELQRVNFALAKVVRERKTLYNDNSHSTPEQKILTENDVAQLADLASVMLESSSTSQKNFSLKIEAISFTSSKNNPSSGLSLSYIKGTTCIFPTQKPLASFIGLTTWTNTGRWMPIYRVTMCTPDRNLISEYVSRLIPGLSNSMAVSNIVISR